MGMLQASLKRVWHSSRAAGLRKVGASRVCGEAGPQPWFPPNLHCTLVMESSQLHSPLLAHIWGLRLACRPESSRTMGFHRCFYMESPRADPGCPQQCPILSSLSQMQAAWATFLLPESLLQAAGCPFLQLGLGTSHCPFHLLVCPFIFFKNTTDLFLLPIWNGYLSSKEKFPYFSFSLSSSRSSLSYPYWVPLIISLFVYFFYLVFLDFANTILTEVNCPFRLGPHPPIVTLSIFLFINVLSPWPAY